MNLLDGGNEDFFKDFLKISIISIILVGLVVIAKVYLQ